MTKVRRIALAAAVLLTLGVALGSPADADHRPGHGTTTTTLPDTTH
ncbi:MAG: hypothetical protein ABR540_06580 [Acidimicrobiales bacterium]